MQQAETTLDPGIEGVAARFARRHCRFELSLRFLQHWIAGFAERDGRGLPDFDPVDVPALLPNLYLLARENDRLRYRVSGEAVNRLFERQNTGRMLDEVVPSTLYAHLAPFFFGVLDGAVCVFSGQLIVNGRECLDFEHSLTPVRRSGRVMLLACLALGDTARLRAGRPPHLAGFRFRTLDLATGGERTADLDLPARIQRAGRPSGRGRRSGQATVR